jgi:hypothetical protein
MIVDEACDGLAKVVQFLLGLGITAPQTLVIEFHGHVCVMEERLMERRQQLKIDS